TNVPIGGMVYGEQEEWLIDELRTAPRDKVLMVTMSHPIYSADTHQSGSEGLRNTLRRASTKAGRLPDIVLAGLVHNYQRATIVGGLGGADGEHEIVYIIAGAGGYPNLHPVRRGPDGKRLGTPFTLNQYGDRVELEKYVDDRHGFLRLEVTPRYVI